MKMRIADGTVVDLDTKWTVWEEIALEDELGWTMKMVNESGAVGSARAPLAFFWLQKRRADKAVRARDLDFSTSELEYLSDDDQVLAPLIDERTGKPVERNGATVMLLPDGTEYVPKDSARSSAS